MTNITIHRPASEARWALHVGNWYLTPEDGQNWSICPTCGQVPRVWVFNHGSQAKCCCFDLYSSGIISESVMAVITRTGSAKEYSRDNLRIAWNDYIEHIVMKD